MLGFAISNPKLSGDLVTTSTPHITKPVYALSNSDGVSAKITHVVLKGSNYTEWAKGFRNGLGAKRKLGFVDGSLKRPAADSANLEDWSTANYTVIAWIFNTIDPTIRSSISYRDTAVELWDDIRNRFSRGNGIKVYQLESELSDCKQKDEESVMEFYGRIKKLWDDVNDYDALPTCDCSGCRCDISAKLRQRCETRQTRQFLMGLIPFYSTARSNILGITLLPSLDSVYSRIMLEEEVRNITQERPTAMALTVQGGGQGAKQGKPRLKCSHCKKPGHNEPNCWDKYGYPEGREPRSAAASGTGGVHRVFTPIRCLVSPQLMLTLSVFRDPILKTRIGEGVLIDGLYHLPMDTPRRVNAIEDAGNGGL